MDQNLKMFCVCLQGSQKRALTTPEHPKSKRSASLITSPGLLLSPASFSPWYTDSTCIQKQIKYTDCIWTINAV